MKLSTGKVVEQPPVTQKRGPWTKGRNINKRQSVQMRYLRSDQGCKQTPLTLC
jgi:hypothetical protein